MADVDHEAPPAKGMTIAEATVTEAPELAALHAAVAEDLTRRYGSGPWSYASSERAVRSAMRTSRVLVGRLDGAIVATLQLQTSKPWAIDRERFTPVGRALCLTGMAVHPAAQRRGIGRACLDEAARIAWAWPADAVRLDSYDAPAGAGEFYARCGWREVGKAVYRGTALRYFELVR